MSAIRTIHEQIRNTVASAFESNSCEALSSVVDDGEGDTIFAVDRISESLLVELFERNIRSRFPIILQLRVWKAATWFCPADLASLTPNGELTPIDGTRFLMYQKRSGWILTPQLREQDSSALRLPESRRIAR